MYIPQPSVTSSWNTRLEWSVRDKMHKKNNNKKQPENKIHKFTSTQIYRYTAWVDVWKETKCTKKQIQKKYQKAHRKKHNLPGWMCAKRQSSEMLLCYLLQVQSCPRSPGPSIIVCNFVTVCNYCLYLNQIARFFLIQTHLQYLFSRRITSLPVHFCPQWPGSSMTFFLVNSG